MKYSEQEYNLWNRDVPKTAVEEGTEKSVLEKPTEKPIVINEHQAFYEARVSGMTPKQQRDHMYMFTVKTLRHYFKHIDTREYVSFTIPPEDEDVVIENGEVLRGSRDEFAEASPEARNAMYRLMRARESDS